MTKTILSVALGSGLSITSYAHPGTGLDPAHDALLHVLSPAHHGWPFYAAIAMTLSLLAGALYAQRTVAALARSGKAG
jgi:hypothetical protein